LWQVQSVATTSSSLNCVRTQRGKRVSRLGAYITAVAFFTNLATISVSYGQILRHLRQSVVAEPRYMREMTNAILRVFVFHVVCWLPSCLLLFLPDTAIVSELVNTIRLFNNFTDFSAMRCMMFLANWLTYASAAGNWIFYAALNRELRNLIR
uniref:G_PROTEIN_RECEP_F1_2 domain-containing protein n=1 Tax=Angiostrongylus cantonensis TaxID=6313 RepID=A0A0K0DNM5_ANGCA